MESTQQDIFSEVFCSMWENEKENEMTDWWLELRLNLSQRPLGGTHAITNILRRGDLVCKLSFMELFQVSYPTAAARQPPDPNSLDLI